MSRLALAAAAVAAVVVLGLAGARTGVRVQGTNLVRPLAPVTTLAPGATLCQAGERVPPGTGSLRFSGAEVSAEVRGTTVCATNRGSAPAVLLGEPYPPARAATIGGAPASGRVRIEYLRPGKSSWWGLRGALASRMATVRDAFPGRGTASVWALLALCVAVGAVRLVAGDATVPPRGTLRPRLRRAVVAVPVLAAVNVLAWGLLVPPFQVPDEPAHMYYAQYLGETGKLPKVSSSPDWYAPDVNASLAASGFYYVIGQPENAPSWDPAARHDPRGLDRVGTANAATASSNPPLYYVAQAGAYRLAHGFSVDARLAALRVLSALLAGLTVLCTFLFLREVLPGSPVAWTAGALLAGLEPMFAFIASGVNNDGGLFLASAALLLVLARVLRRGLTTRRAIAVGVLLTAGALVKTQMLAFAPAAGLALVVGAWRARDPRPLLGAAAAGALPLLVYGVLGATAWERPLIDRASAATIAIASGSRFSGGVWEEFSYVWEEFLPRLPGMPHLLPATRPWRLWFKGLVGNFGWLDYGFPAWTYFLALAVVAAVLVLAAAEMWRLRGAASPAAGVIAEIAVYALFAAGLLVAVGVVSYRAVASSGQPFEQARYLLPLLPLFVLVPAFAARRSAGIATALVIAAAAFSVYAQLLTLARYYG